MIVFLIITLELCPQRPEEQAKTMKRAIVWSKSQNVQARRVLIPAQAHFIYLLSSYSQNHRTPTAEPDINPVSLQSYPESKLEKETNYHDRGHRVCSKGKEEKAKINNPSHDYG